MPIEGKGVTECLAEVKITKEDITSHPPKNTIEVMCFMKCLMFRNGKIDAKGKINVEKVEEDLSKVPGLTDKQKVDFKKCVIAVDKIEKCEDIKKIRLCWLALSKHH